MKTHFLPRKFSLQAYMQMRQKGRRENTREFDNDFKSLLTELKINRLLQEHINSFWQHFFICQKSLKFINIFANEKFQIGTHINQDCLSSLIFRYTFKVPQICSGEEDNIEAQLQAKDDTDILQNEDVFPTSDVFNTTLHKITAN